MSVEHIAVVGAGAWGTALALAAERAGRRVTLFGRDVAAIAVSRENVGYLPGIRIPETIAVTDRLADVVGADAILVVTPTQTIRAVASLLGGIADDTPVVLCAKGLERGTGLRPTEVLAEALPPAAPVVLSGPSFAADVAAGLPTAVTIAAAEAPLAMRLCQALGSASFRPYAETDMIGVEVGGAFKNVLAIAVGIVAGRGLGASAAAALTARGFAELRRIGAALGARPDTLMGLSGLGDLILTCGSAQSRNMSLGRGLGEGRTLSEILGGRSAVTEGVYTAAALVGLARSKAVEMPIAEAVHEIIEGRLGVDEAIAGLMQRPLKAED